jgi:hypothetical protein
LNSELFSRHERPKGFNKTTELTQSKTRDYSLISSTLTICARKKRKYLISTSFFSHKI